MLSGTTEIGRDAAGTRLAPDPPAGTARDASSTGLRAASAACPPIAYLVSRYPAYNHTFILREIRALRAQGFDLRAASVSAADRPPDRMTAEEREEEAATFYIKPAGVAGALAAAVRTLARSPVGLAKALSCALSLAGPDPRRIAAHLLYFVEAVVFADWMASERLGHFHTHFSSTVGLIAARAFGLRMSMTLHGPAEFEDAKGFNLAEKVAASTFACAISHYGRSQMMLHSAPEHWDRLAVAPLGIDPTVFDLRPPRDDPRPFEIVCVGRLAAVKAQHVLVDAVGRLADSGRDVLLRLVGDGPDRASLEREVARRGLSGRVIFEGWRNQDAVLEIYRRADAFALASFAEGVPVVLMEAMAMGIPCVATRITGVPELIRDGVDGLLVAPSDAEDLARAIGALVDDPELRRRLALEGRRRVLARYDLATNVGRLAEIFRARIPRGAGVS